MEDTYIVIGKTAKAFDPKIMIQTNDEEYARAFAHKKLRETGCAVNVFNLCTGLCVLALTNEAPER